MPWKGQETSAVQSCVISEREAGHEFQSVRSRREGKSSRGLALQVERVPIVSQARDGLVRSRMALDSQLATQ
jgi:hypothetical protein